MLRGITLNRTPGYHFPVHFLRVSFDHVARPTTRLSIDPGPHCVDAADRVHLGALAMLGDLAMSASIRAGLAPEQRLGTVTMSLHLTGAHAPGRVTAEATFEGFVEDANGAQGLSRYVLRAGDVTLGFGGGGFMVLDPPAGVVMHPVGLRKREDPLPPLVPIDELRDDERAVLARAEAALTATRASGGAFVDAFWGAAIERTDDGAKAVVENAGHVANRVGHMQGGLLLAFGARTAEAALHGAPSTAPWRTSAIHVAFVSPGEGAALHARSRVVHRGRLTAVVRTEVTRADGRLVLDVSTHHAAGRA